MGHSGNTDIWKHCLSYHICIRLGVQKFCCASYEASILNLNLPNSKRSLCQICIFAKLKTKIHLCKENKTSAFIN